MRLGGDQELPELPRGRSTARPCGSWTGGSSRRDEDVVELTLAAPDGATLSAWHAGAHIDLHLPSGRTRQYSLCGDPRRERRVPDRGAADPGGGGGSVEVHGLTVGQIVEISDPRNAFMMPLPGSGSRAEKLRFIAGGIGITPILPMVRLAERLGVPWSLCYTGRHRDSLPFVDELLAFGDKVRVRTDDEHGLPTRCRAPGRGGPADRGVRVWAAADDRGRPSKHPARVGHRVACRAVLSAAGGRRDAVRVGAGARRQRWWRSRGPERLGRVAHGPAQRELLLPARLLRHLRPAGGHRRGGAPRQHPHRPATGARSDAGLRLQSRSPKAGGWSWTSSRLLGPAAPSRAACLHASRPPGRPGSCVLA